MVLNVSKEKNILANGLIEKTSSMLDEKVSKTVHKDEGRDRQKEKN